MMLSDELPTLLEVGRPLKRIFIHCSDTPGKMDIGADEIDRWHREKGWAGIGYHFVVRRDGTIETGRVISRKGAHARGHNGDSIAVCIVGRGDYDDHQILKMYQLVEMLCQKYDIGVSGVVGHTEVDSGKGCPLYNMATVRSMLKTMGVRT